MPDPDIGRAGPRRVRSFVRREGRITPAQERALVDLWPRFGIEPGNEPLDWGRLFGRESPVCCEIGFGNGECLAAMAADRPDWDFVGVEVHRPGIGALLLRLEKSDLDNVKIVCADAVDFLKQRVPKPSFQRLCVFFPDPWPKKRHHKRRLVQPGFADLAVDCLRADGVLHCATDWEDYATQMLDVWSRQGMLTNLSETGDFCPCPEWRIETRFERRGRRLGHASWDLIFEKRPR